jgi:hypothetical protein
MVFSVFFFFFFFFFGFEQRDAFSLVEMIVFLTSCFFLFNFVVLRERKRERLMEKK